MKSREAGLSVRFFRVTIPMGMPTIGNATGKTLISGRLVGNFSIEVERIERKRPVAKRPIRASVEC
jgi:hypothetical protein